MLSQCWSTPSCRPLRSPWFSGPVASHLAAPSIGTSARTRTANLRVLSAAPLPDWATANRPAWQSQGATAVHLLEDWFDPIEAGLRDRVREFIQAMIESELETALARPRYGRHPRTDAENTDGRAVSPATGTVTRSRSLTGTFGRVEITVPPCCSAKERTYLRLRTVDARAGH
jgi:hypothetical protein